MRKRMFAATAAVALVATGVVATIAVGGSTAAKADDTDEIQQVPSKITGITPLPSGEWQATVVIGPITAKPHTHPGEDDGGDAGGHDDGGHDGGHDGGAMVGPMHGPTEPMHGAHTTAQTTIRNNSLLGSVYTVGVQPDLVYADGSRADIDSGMMLHHSVLGDKGGTDYTCGGTELGARFGKRVFASGNERTAARLPRGYGMKGASELFAEIELMNMTDQPKTVYHTLKVTVANPFLSWMTKRVEPVWLDQAGCDSRSEFPVPKGESEHSWEWKSTLSGTVKAVGGHLHDGGQTLTVSNASTGQTFCDMTAKYGTKPTSDGHLDAMVPVCTGSLGTIKKGDTVRQHNTYHINYADPGAMAISLMYIAPS